MRLQILHYLPDDNNGDAADIIADDKLPLFYNGFPYISDFGCFYRVPEIEKYYNGDIEIHKYDISLCNSVYNIGKNTGKSLTT